MPDTGSELARLKDLLLRPETSRLDSLRRQVDALDERLGTRDRLESATAEILVNAFRDAEHRQHRELSRAVAPVVVAAIQSEIRNSRDMMVEALYPITGRLVAAAVADAFRNLVTTINERVDTMMSMRLWKLRVRSWITRRPLSELLLAEATRPHLKRLLFLERGSGAVFAHWASDPADDARSDLVSGMIAAIMEFSSSVFESGSGELRTIDMGASCIFLQASARFIVAGEVIGPMRPQDEANLHEEFARLAEMQQGSHQIAADDLGETARVFDERAVAEPKKKSGGLGIWIVLALLLAAIAALGWRSWSRSSFESGVRQAVAETIGARPQLQAYPLTVDVDHGARQIRLNGLAPANEDADALRQAVSGRAGDYAVASNIGIVMSQQSAAQAVSDMRGEIARLTGELEAQRSAARETAASQSQALVKLGNDIAALAQSMQGGKSEIATLVQRLDEMRAGLQQRIDELQEQVGDPQLAVQRFAHSQAIFFERDAVLRDPDTAAKTLDTLAGLLRAANAGVRLVGFAGESGSNAVNQRVAKERVQIVAEMLEKRGIAAANIVIALRGTSSQLDSSDDRPGHSNRRVQFEILFETEKPSP